MYSKVVELARYKVSGGYYYYLTKNDADHIFSFHNFYDLLLCEDRLVEYFELPEKYKRMWLKISDKPFYQSYQVDVTGGLIKVKLSNGRWVKNSEVFPAFYDLLVYSKKCGNGKLYVGIQYT